MCLAYNNMLPPIVCTEATRDRKVATCKERCQGRRGRATRIYALYTAKFKRGSKNNVTIFSNFARNCCILSVQIVTYFSARFEFCRVQRCMPSSPSWSLCALELANYSHLSGRRVAHSGTDSRYTCTAT